MTRFRAGTNNEAIVAASRADIWAVITDPVLLPQLTPLLRKIDADGDLWTWHMTRISALGVGVTPVFTERMTFDTDACIRFEHDPPAGARERTAASGRYELSDTESGTKLTISLTLDVDLPLPRQVAPAVKRVMTSLIRRTGEQFSANLCRHLGLEESDVRMSA